MIGPGPARDGGGGGGQNGENFTLSFFDRLVFLGGKREEEIPSNCIPSAP
jgi:hypothetical protein